MAFIYHSDKNNHQLSSSHGVSSPIYISRGGHSYGKHQNYDSIDDALPHPHRSLLSSTGNSRTSSFSEDVSSIASFDTGERKWRRTVHGGTRLSQKYTKLDCALQKDKETPYYVGLAAEIFGIRTVIKDPGANHAVEEDHFAQKFEYEVDERISYDEFNTHNNMNVWVCLPDSIVSLNLGLCLSPQLHEKDGDFLAAFLTLGFLPLIGTIFVELSTVTALGKYASLDTIEDFDTEYFCEQGLHLQLAVVGIFMISLLKPLYDIICEIMVGISSSKCVFNSVALQQLFIRCAGAEYTKNKDFEKNGNFSLIVKGVSTSWLSFCVFWFSLGMEIYIFYLTARIGVTYTLSQEDASAIVQAAVAISFINEIDNLLFSVIVPTEVKDVISSCEYEIKNVPKITESKGSWLYFFANTATLTCQMPVLMVLTAFVVFNLRYHHCGKVFH